MFYAPIYALLCLVYALFMPQVEYVGHLCPYLCLFFIANNTLFIDFPPRVGLEVETP